MKFIIWLGLASFLVCGARAGQDQATDLVAVMENAVGVAAHGDVSSALRELNTQAKSPRSLKEVNAQTEVFKAAYAKVSQLGELDDVERISLVFTGESFFRLRMAEKRAEGVIVWTLIGYRFKGIWYCKGTNFNGSDDLMSLMRQELDPADAQPGTK